MAAVPGSRFTEGINYIRIRTMEVTRNKKLETRNRLKFRQLTDVDLMPFCRQAGDMTLWFLRSLTESAQLTENSP